MAEPGEIFSYSNAGFSLLGLVAETLRHTPYRQLMQEEVFAPLHMDRTYLLPSEVLDDGDFALGTCPAAQPECGGFGVGPIIAPADYDNAWGRPPAGAWSSVLDLAKFTRFLVQGDAGVLSDELRAVMASPQISTRYAGDELSYGLGLEMATGFALDDADGQTTSFYGSKVIFHDGLLPGFRSMVQCLPSADFCFIALANATEVSFSTLSQAAFRLSALPAPSPRPQLGPDPERFAAYAGTYLDPLANGALRVSVDGTGGLQLDFLVLDAFQIPYVHQLTPTLVDNFVFDIAGAPQALTFLAGPTGSYDYLRIFDRQVAARVADAARQ
jgi:hypothetical protein